jgi:hypothetical protein
LSTLSLSTLSKKLSQYNLSFTGDSIDSTSSIDSVSKQQEINLSLSISATTETATVDHESQTSQHHQEQRFHGQIPVIPRPNLLPRPSPSPSQINLNRVPHNRSMRIPSPTKQGFMMKSSSSAFSSPGIQYHKNNVSPTVHAVSPVPSIIASECSESTWNTSFQSHTPSFNYNHIGDVESGRTKQGSGGANSFVQNLSLQASSSSPLTVTTPISPEQYYFTPVHNGMNDRNSLPYYPEDTNRQADNGVGSARPGGYFPQCREVPNSIYMTGLNAQMNYGYTRYANQMQSQMHSTRPGSFHKVHPNPMSNYNVPMYCHPTNDSFEKRSSVPKMVSTQSNSTYLAATVKKGKHIESPVRLRKVSVDSFDSSLSTLQTSSSDENNSCSSPLPQNLKGDPHRQAKVKTELCLHYARGKECPFGSRCNYAHGEDELKYKKLHELERAGLVEDINVYRTHPCPSWVATGAW